MKFGASYLLDFGGTEYSIQEMEKGEGGVEPPVGYKRPKVVAFHMFFNCKECSAVLWQSEVHIPVDFFISDSFATRSEGRYENISDVILSRLVSEFDPWYDRYIFDIVMKHAEECEGFKKLVAIRVGD